MKPTLQQEKILKSYLADILKYRETIDEVYDHVLSAVEEKPENISFQDAVNQILNDDFKGGKGLVKMEKQHLRDATWEGFVQIVRYIKSDFKFPNVLYTTGLFGAIYYIINHINISIGQLVFLYPISVAIYIILMWTRRFFVGYYTGSTKLSIHDLIIVRTGYPSYWGFLLFMSPLSIKPKFYNFIMIDHPEILTGILTLYFLYLSAIIKICRDEFKPYFAK